MLAAGSWSTASWAWAAVLLAVTLAVSDARRPISSTTKCGRARVAISVSPLLRSKEMRVLELSWSYDRPQPGDRVALYDYDPVARRQWDDSNRRNEPVPDSDAGADPTSSHYTEFDYNAGPRPSTAPQGVPQGGSWNTAPQGSPQGLPQGGGWNAAPQGLPQGGSWNTAPQGLPQGGSWNTAPQGLPQGGSWNAAPAQGGSLFPAGYPRDAFSGRARRAADGGLEDGPPLAVVGTDGMPTGWRATNIQEQHTPSGQLGYAPRCLNYWATYERPLAGPSDNRTQVLAVTCLRTRPTWMADFRREIGHLRLVDLFIPGTHDSASVQEDGRQNIIDRYTVTQDESVLGQLIYGVRYIDLRVGFYSNKKDKQWWANHGVVRMQPLHAVLADIKAFMGNTDEIVILDIQNFPAGFGNDNKVHLKLVHLLETELGELMAYWDVNRGWRLRLDDVWASGRRLVVAYDKEDVLPASRKLWRAVRQFWGDAQTPEQLTDYASNIMSQHNIQGFAWALMAELTPNARLIASNPTGSLRRLAHKINRNVTAWAEGPWGEAMNTLAVDFVRSTGVVEAAVWHNLRRGGVDVCNAYRLLDSV